MSRILDALERIGRESSAPMGFSNTTRETKRRPMVILGYCSREHTDLGVASSLKFDATVINLNVLPHLSVRGDIAPLKNLLWGVELYQLTQKREYREYRKRGADFFVFDGENINVKVLEDDGAGFFLRIEPSLEDRYLRTIESLPVDGVIVRYTESPPITLQGLMELSALRSMVDKYLLLEISSNITKVELESLLHIGVDGLLLDTDYRRAKSVEKLIRYSDEISRLPKEKPRRSTALLPHGPYDSESSSSQEEEGEGF